MRVLLLVTTHLSLEHITFLRKCWPPATHKSSLLREADVTVYISGHLTKNATRALAVAFPPVDRNAGGPHDGMWRQRCLVQRSEVQRREVRDGRIYTSAHVGALRVAAERKGSRSPLPRRRPLLERDALS